MYSFIIVVVLCLVFEVYGQGRGSAAPTNAELIAALDNNGDGKLSSKELRKCKDCNYKCICDALKNALEQTENNPDRDGDRKLSEDEIPSLPQPSETPDYAPVITVEEIFQTVDQDDSTYITSSELRTCIQSYVGSVPETCHLNCQCKKYLKCFPSYAGGDRKLQLSEIPTEETATSETTSEESGRDKRGKNKKKNRDYCGDGRRGGNGRNGRRGNRKNGPGNRRNRQRD